MNCKRCGIGPFESQRQLAGHGRHCKVSYPDDVWICSNCGTLPLSSFYKQGDGWCKECFRKHTEKYKKEHEEKEKEYNKKRWQERKNDPEYKEYRHKYMKKWRKTEVAKRHRAAQRHNRRARIVEAGGTFTTDDLAKLIEQYDKSCPHCYQREPFIHMTPDHVQSLSNGGSNFIENIQPLCWGLNEKQSDYTNYDFRKGYKALWFNLVFSPWFINDYKPGTRKLPEGIKKYTLEEVRDIADKREYDLLSTIYVNSYQTLDFRCRKCNNIWKSTFKNFSYHQCPECMKIQCAIKHRKNVEEINEVALKIGLRLIGEYKSMNDATEWICLEKQHVLQMKPAYVFYDGRGCKYCNLDKEGKGYDKTGKYCQQLATENNGVYDGPLDKIVKQDELLPWKCQHNVPVRRSYADIKKFGLTNIKNCDECNNIRKHKVSGITIESCNEFLSKYKLKTISEKYVNNDKLLKIKCNDNHEFERSWTNLRKRPTCPTCAEANSVLSQKQRVEGISCVHCESANIKSRGSYKTDIGRKKRYQCMDCLKTFTDQYDEKEKRETIDIVVPVVKKLNLETSKKCNECNIIKNVEEFYEKRKTCKDCINSSDADWYRENRFVGIFDSLERSIPWKTCKLCELYKPKDEFYAGLVCKDCTNENLREKTTKTSEPQKHIESDDIFLQILKFKETNDKYPNAGTDKEWKAIDERLRYRGSSLSQFIQVRFNDTKEPKYVVWKDDINDIEVVSLRKFCEENNLSASHMFDLAKGIGSSHKGWYCRYANTSRKEWFSNNKVVTNTYEFTSPNGEKFVVKSGKDGEFKKFLETHQLSRSNVFDVINSKRPHHKNWIIKKVIT